MRKESYIIALSHFIVEEFLLMNVENVFICVARKYLVDYKNDIYLLDVYLICIIHEKFKDTILIT